MSSFTLGIAKASFALPSLNHDLFPVSDIQAMGRRLDLTTLEVEEASCRFLLRREHRYDTSTTELECLLLTPLRISILFTNCTYTVDIALVGIQSREGVAIGGCGVGVNRSRSASSCCTMCAGALGWSQIPRIVYGCRDEKRGYTDYAPHALHPKCTVTGGILENECRQLMQDFFKGKR